VKPPEDILERMPVPVAMFKGPDHVYAFANRVHDEVMGRTNVVGKAFRDVYPELVGTPILDALDRVYRTGEPFSAGELSLPLVREGTKRDAFFKFAIEPLRDEMGSTEGLLTVGTEVTDHVLAREELGAALEVERSTEALRERLLAIVGHDLRNPLSTVTVSAHMLLKQQALTPAQTKIARRILTSSERMGRMIAEILDFAQGRLGGGIPVTRTFVNLHEIATRTVDELALLYPDRRIALRLEGGGNGDWDSDRMVQLLANLVLNALRYAHKDAPIHVVVRGEDEHVVLEVAHTGPPIPADVLARIFDPFLRATEEANAPRPARGLGLALYIVERIVSAHGGKVGARSGPDETAFFAEVPRAYRTSGF